MNDKQLETIMGRLLQIGVLTAALAMLAGGVYYLVLHGGETPAYRSFHGVVQVRGAAILWAGVLVMIATPVLRVIFAVVAFAIERDWLYTGVSAVVLALLAYSFIA
jgi:uncharacterized membrane protein